MLAVGWDTMEKCKQGSVKHLCGVEACFKKNYPGKRPQTVCARSTSRKSKNLDALRSKELMCVMKVGIVVTVAVVVSE